jgi:squalene-hopene/tetraprenyl-beta-curcumene cyclase
MASNYHIHRKAKCQNHNSISKAKPGLVHDSIGPLIGLDSIPIWNTLPPNMRTLPFLRLPLAVSLAVLTVGLVPVARATDLGSSPDSTDISLKHEIQVAINRGLDWLASNQNATNGSWSAAEYPAMTALALSAFMGDPSGDAKARHSGVVDRGYKFVIAHVKPDGGIYHKDLQNYNTSICMMALVNAHNADYNKILLNARRWLVAQQSDFNTPGKVDSPFDGGIGYGGSPEKHSDLNNTLTALEALYYTKDLPRDAAATDSRDLNWAAAIQFIQNCQNLTNVNNQPWVSTNAADRGGFIYSPDQSKAGGQTNDAGRVSLRSYGTISYAGLLSYIYCDLKIDDPRVGAVYEWLRLNYTVDENPGMGAQGYYYYLHLMAKGLTACNAKTIALKDGKSVNWRREAALKLINLQKSNGSWANENGRWLEKDPALVTAYSVMALEFIYRGL